MNLSALLPEDVDPGGVFPLQAMYTNLVRRHPGPPDAPVCGPHQSDGDPTIDVSARPIVGLMPIFARRLDILFRVAVASAPSSPSMEEKKGWDCWRYWRHASK